MNKKKHNMEAGYVAERTNPHVPGEKVVIYVAVEQGMDVGGKKYAVFCDAHGTLCGAKSVPDARIMMREPKNFCDGCRLFDR